jgi:hypothetical protein
MLDVAGLTIQLGGPDDGDHVVSAGRVVLDAETFEVISRSGHDASDYAAVIYAALREERRAMVQGLAR